MLGKNNLEWTLWMLNSDPQKLTRMAKFMNLAPLLFENMTYISTNKACKKGNLNRRCCQSIREGENLTALDKFHHKISTKWSLHKKLPKLNKN